MSGRYRLLALLLIARCQLAEHDSAEALDRARGNDSFRGAADAEQQVDSSALARRQDRPGDLPVADLLSVEQHGGFVLLALADNYDAVHGPRADQLPHRADCRAVGTVLVASTDPAPGREGSSLSDPGQLKRQVTVRGAWFGFQRYRHALLSHRCASRPLGVPRLTVRAACHHRILRSRATNR